MKPVPPTIRTRPLVVVGVVGDDVAAGAIALLLGVELIVTMLVCKMEGS
jgi:heme A synthase